MAEGYTSPRFVCKSILRMEDQWLVTFPDYESAGENPFAVREASRLMPSHELLEWLERRIIRIGGAIAKELVEKHEVETPAPLAPLLRKPNGNRIRTTEKMKKLKCGHLHPRRKGVYPRRCKSCEKHFHQRVIIMRRKML